jgi:hypothetical protein
MQEILALQCPGLNKILFELMQEYEILVQMKTTEVFSGSGCLECKIGS